MTNFVFMQKNQSLECPHCLSARATKNGRKKKNGYLYWGANKEDPLLTMLMLEWIALKACLFALKPLSPCIPQNTSQFARLLRADYLSD